MSYSYGWIIDAMSLLQSYEMCRYYSINKLYFDISSTAHAWLLVPKLVPLTTNGEKNIFDLYLVKTTVLSHIFFLNSLTYFLIESVLDNP